MFYLRPNAVARCCPKVRFLPEQGDDGDGGDPLMMNEKTFVDEPCCSLDHSFAMFCCSAFYFSLSPLDYAFYD